MFYWFSIQSIFVIEYRIKYTKVNGFMNKMISLKFKTLHKKQKQVFVCHEKKEAKLL